MSTTYTNNTKLAKPAASDRTWDVPLNANTDALEAMAPLSGLNVSLAEVPSTTLNVRVAPGTYLKGDGSKQSYAGTSSQAITTTTTRVLYLTDSGTLTVGSSYPTSGAYTPLATVVAGATTITSITDDRVAGGRVLFTLGSYANDTAASAGGVPIGGLYHTSGTVKIRLT